MTGRPPPTWSIGCWPATGSRTSFRRPPSDHYPPHSQLQETTMPVNKEHKEFHAVDMTTGWEVPPGYPPGIEQKVLAGALDEASKRGGRTRLLRFQPGVYTTAPFVHD